jgi:hypothetical protein
MTDYTWTKNNTAVTRTSDGATIPANPANSEWRDYLAWVEAGGVTDPYVAPVPEVPQQISDRQFFQQLAVLGIITEAEALASNAAVIPPPLEALIDAMPVDQQFAAKMIVSGATIYHRDAALTVAIGTAYGWSAGQIDAFFTAAAAL